MDGSTGGSRAQNADLCAIVLDDSETDRYLLMRMCRGVGLRMEEAEDLEDLRRLLNAGPRDIVFVDHLLGQATGLDALDMLARVPGHRAMVKILLTGMRDPAVLAAAYDHGATECIDKSNMDRATLQRIIDLRRAIGAPATGPGAL